MLRGAGMAAYGLVHATITAATYKSKGQLAWISRGLTEAICRR